jgi:hypothetical protein
MGTRMLPRTALVLLLASCLLAQLLVRVSSRVVGCDGSCFDFLSRGATRYVMSRQADETNILHCHFFVFLRSHVVLNVIFAHSRMRNSNICRVGRFIRLYPTSSHTVTASKLVWRPFAHECRGR